MKALKRAGIVLIVAFAAAQLIRPGRANPPTDAGRTIQAHEGAALAAVLDRSCGDCHSNNTVWPSYAQVAPLSWLMARAVSEGRNAVNFSEWAAYAPDARRTLLSASCEDVTSGKMPGIYTRIRPETRLSAADVETICTAARSKP
jgi:Haem-binding domain